MLDAGLLRLEGAARESRPIVGTIPALQSQVEGALSGRPMPVEPEGQEWLKRQKRDAKRIEPLTICYHILRAHQTVLDLV